MPDCRISYKRPSISLKKGNTGMSMVQFILYLSINCLFLAKYGSRLTPHYWLFLLAYVLIATAVWFFLSGTRKSGEETWDKFLYLSLAVVGVAGITFLIFLIDPYSVKVDRWSAIHNFISYLLAGKYPYAAHTHLGGYGSPFPVWQCFHIPFYLLGDVGWAMLFSFVLLTVMLFWLFKSYRSASVFLIFILISPAFWYEAAVRSDLLYNFMLCFLCVGVFHKKQLSIGKQAAGLGVICGLFLSTRLSVAIPLALYLFPYFLKAGNREKVTFMGVALLTFVATFLPFVLWDHQKLLFFKYNPFVLQTRQGSMLELILVLVSVLYLSTRWKKFRDFSGYVAICLILMVAVTFLHYMIVIDFQRSLFSTSFDITYFNMALPFLIYAFTKGEISSGSESSYSHSMVAGGLDEMS